MPSSGMKSIRPSEETEYRDDTSSTADAEQYQELQFERSQTLWDRTFSSLGLSRRRRQERSLGFDYSSVSRDELADHQSGWRLSVHAMRRPRRSAFDVVKRTLIALPVVVLVIL